MFDTGADLHAAPKDVAGDGTEVDQTSGAALRDIKGHLIKGHCLQQVVVQFGDADASWTPRQCDDSEPNTWVRDS